MYFLDSLSSRDKCIIQCFTVEFDLGKDATWIKFNAGQRGFYRVNYDPEGWDALIHVLHTNHTTLSAADRASLIDDVFTLVK